MDQQQTRNFLHQRNGEMDRTNKEMYGHKWWLCWKISVQCGRELNFLHSDIIVIILHGQILILYNWRTYLSITPRSTCVQASLISDTSATIIITLPSSILCLEEFISTIITKSFLRPLKPGKWPHVFWHVLTFYAISRRFLLQHQCSPTN